MAGRSTREALIAACTSRAAPSMLRLRSNCRVTRAEPVPLCDVISLTPASLPRRRSSGVATLVAMVSGLPPGRLALTEIVGKSTCGRGETGSTKNAPMPASATPTVSSTVPIGRRTKGAERFMSSPYRRPLPSGGSREQSLLGSLSRSRESVGGEPGLSSRLRRARRTVPACQPERAPQGRAHAAAHPADRMRGR